MTDSPISSQVDQLEENESQSQLLVDNDRIKDDEIQPCIMFSFMNKCIDEDVETTDNQCPTRGDQQSPDKSIERSIQQKEIGTKLCVPPQPQIKNIIPPASLSVVEQNPSTGICSLEKYLMEPIQNLKVSEFYEVQLKRNKRQLKREKCYQKQKDFERREKKRRQQKMQTLFNGVSSYFY